MALRPTQIRDTGAATAGGPFPAGALSHVALFMHGFEAGGAQRRTLALAGALADRGLRVDMVVVRAEGPLRPELPGNVRLMEVGGRAARLPGFGGSRPTRLAAGIPGLVGYLRDIRPQVLMSAANHATLAAILAHRRAGVAETALVIRISNALIGGRDRPRDRLKRWMIRQLYGAADGVVAVSADMAREIGELVPGLADRTRVVGNPVVDAGLAARAALPPAHPWLTDGGPPVLLAAGRMEPQKDFATLLRAAAHLRRTRPVRLLILGDGTQRAELERMAAELGLEADVLSMPGFDPNPLPAMAHAACFILSSRWEGMPGALIEAMAVGCPVVSTDCPGGSREVLLDGTLGPLVPVGDAGALAAAVAGVLDAPPTRSDLMARARDFSVETAAAGYHAALEAAWLRRAASAGP